VAPLDIDMPAAAALDLAQIWAARFGAEDHDAMQIDALYIAPGVAGGNAAAGGRPEVEVALHREIERSATRIGQIPKISTHPVIRSGSDPADEILRYLKEVEADLVVLGTRGFGAIRRALIGSVASTIARLAPCPVLLVPPVLWRGEQRD
jgi:nucleotide-binding universal stress UspA family protein